MRNAQVRAATGAAQPNLDRVPNDYFRTHESATRALLAVETFSGTVWEPACGSGEMAKVLLDAEGVERIVATDLIDRGYGEAGRNFLMVDPPPGVDHLVTNPPFELLDAFANRALDLNLPGKVALFARLAWLEGAARRRGVFARGQLSRVWVFPQRPLLARSDGPYQTGLIAFAWFVFEASHAAPTWLGGWLSTR